jgi:acetyltransferase-like isoleucine patch superfamily enzyme
MRPLRSIIELVRGWSYLIAFISGGAFIRQARFRSRGSNVKISPTAFFKYAEHIRIGDNTFVNHLCSIWAAPKSSITIGNDVLLGPGTCLIASNHGTYADELVREQEGEDRDIAIGNDVWLGANVSVLAGVTIGDGCIVGAGAVVTKNLPPRSICVGVPAKVIGWRKLRGGENDRISATQTAYAGASVSEERFEYRGDHD